MQRRVEERTALEALARPQVDHHLRTNRHDQMTLHARHCRHRPSLRTLSIDEGRVP
jgi:hypothetical protein